MENRYDMNSRFRRFRTASWPEVLIIVRLAITIAYGVYALSWMQGISALSKLSQVAVQSASLRLTLVCVLFAAIVGMAIAAIVLFGKRKKQFVPIYLVTVGLCIAYYMFFYQVQYLLALVSVESFIIAYLFTSKYVAVRFGIYNKLNRMALDVWVLRTDLGEQKEKIISELEDAANQYCRSKISAEEFAQVKSELIARL